MNLLRASAMLAPIAWRLTVQRVSFGRSMAKLVSDLRVNEALNRLRAEALVRLPLA
jgi:hypothetical protein